MNREFCSRFVATVAQSSSEILLILVVFTAFVQLESYISVDRSHDTLNFEPMDPGGLTPVKTYVTIYVLTISKCTLISE